MGKIAVVALGGNALIKKGEKATIHSQYVNITRAMESLIPLIKNNYSIVISHGNGFQIGSILIRVEEALGKAYSLPLEVCVAESQGEIGYLIEQSLQNILEKHRIKRSVVSFLSQVLVNKNDPAFKNPTKPVGPFYSEKHAGILMKKGFNMVKQVSSAGSGYRRVVASPRPLKIDNVDIINHLAKERVIVIAAGGGGIPVVKTKSGLKGVPAVIDKDLASACLAKSIKADILLILTGVKKVALNYKNKNEVLLKKMTIKEAQKYLRQGHFPPGSMGPKIEAAIDFVKSTKKKAVITCPACVEKALKGKEGTVIEYD